MSEQRAPTHDLIRMCTVDATVDGRGVYVAGSVPTTAGLRADEDGDGLGTLYGYPVVFGTWTEINSWWEGHFLERVGVDSLNEHLAKRGDRVKTLFEHGYDPQVGNKPMGKPNVQRADPAGLYSETPLVDTSYNRDLAQLIASGAIDGQSFRFSVVRETWFDPDEPSEHNPSMLPERTLDTIRMPENGPVTFPAYEATTLGLRTAAEVRAWQSGGLEVRTEILRGIAASRNVEHLDVRAVLDSHEHNLSGASNADAGPETATAAARDTEARETLGAPRATDRDTLTPRQRRERLTVAIGGDHT